MNDEWWGYSGKHEWVYLDRTLPSNESGSSAKLVFIQCSTGEPFEEERSAWEPPEYQFEVSYIDSLDESSSASARNLLAVYKGRKDQYSPIIDSLRTNQIADLHRKFLADKGVGYPGHSVKGQHSSHRTTHCWHCKNGYLDSRIHLECNSCHWIICNKCGACSMYGCKGS